MNTKSYIVQRIATLFSRVSLRQAMANLIVSVLLLSSCLKEDTSNCPEQIRVYFDITTRATGDAIQPEEVDRMNLYVFSGKGYYLGEYHDDYIANFDANYYIDCSDLLPGEYHFIAWAGKDEQDYSAIPSPFVKGKTKLEEALLILDHADGIVTSTIHHLFHSELPATVTNEKVQRFDMPLIQHTNTINIYIEGFPAHADSYTFEIADNNSEYLFDRSFADSQTTLKYVADCTKDGTNQLFSTLNVMRLAEDRHTPQLQIYNKTSGELLYPVGGQSGNLISLIKRAYPENDFDLTHTYDIVFRFTDGGGEGDPTRFTVTILVNGWEVRSQNNELT